MLFLYNILTLLVTSFLPFVALFNKKIKHFVEGRKKTFLVLEANLSEEFATIWVHVASLGEFEQGLPIIKALKQKYPEKKIVLTFFSPSGYEIKKNSTDADVIVYLPMDKPSRVRMFLSLVRPQMAIFVKYDFWINYLLELKKRKIPTYLVSGIFRKEQIFFRPYAGIMRKILETFTHFFVQDKTSLQLLHSIGFDNVTISGDTRFDRVYEILNRDNTLDFVREFKEQKICVVFGSSWSEDIAMCLSFINNSQNIKIIIAPHNINPIEIQNVKKSITKKVVLYSEIEGKNLSQYDVLIIDTIGILTKIYSYADIAYVGGGMKTGLHNVLEPAVFGIPVVIGKYYHKFLEAKDLVAEGGVLSVHDSYQFDKAMTLLIAQKQVRTQMGEINYQYIKRKQGATQAFINVIT